MLRVYSIFDDKAQVFNTPFFSINHGTALRAFGDLCNDTRSSISRYPQDFHLYCLGEFDEDKGCIVNAEHPEFIAHAVNMVHIVDSPVSPEDV